MRKGVLLLLAAATIGVAWLTYQRRASPPGPDKTAQAMQAAADDVQSSLAIVERALQLQLAGSVTPAYLSLVAQQNEAVVRDATQRMEASPAAEFSARSRDAARLLRWIAANRLSHDEAVDAVARLEILRAYFEAQRGP